MIGPNFTTQYVDMLYEDLGINSRRKKSILSEMFEPYKPSDFKNTVGEWQSQRTSRMDKRPSSRSLMDRSWAKLVIGSCILCSAFGWAIATQFE